MGEPIVLPGSMSRAYNKLVEARADMKALDRVARMKDLDLCSDCATLHETAVERRDAVVEALQEVLAVHCPCTPKHILTAHEIVESGCMVCKAKVVLEV